MTAFPNYAAGQRLTAGLLASGQTNVLFQVADQTVSNTVTLVASPDLAFQALANASYVIHARIAYSTTAGAQASSGVSTAASPDARFHWIGPAGGSFQKYTMGPDINGAVDFASGDSAGITLQMQRRSSTTAKVGGGGAAAYMIYNEDTIYRNGGTTSLLSFAFSQNLASATASLILRADSMLEYYRIA